MLDLENHENLNLNDSGVISPC